MDPGGSIWTCFFLVSICVWVVTGTPLVTTTINCASDSVEQSFGPVDEGYTGDVELITGIEAGKNVKLEYDVFPDHLQFVELSFTPGETTATIRTKKPLDADVLADSDRQLWYMIKCVGAPGQPQFGNKRRLTINDINDNGPVFEKKLYTADVSETKQVDTDVLRVKAVDSDSSPENNRVSYTMVPATEDFIITSTGALILKRRLNYNVVPTYSFTVTASDKWGWNDTANVQINVVDFDNLNPYFSHNLYQAFIAENTEGPFRTILPEAIKAQDGDKGINMTLTYSISAVSPSKYQPNFHIDPSSGVLSVVTPIDRETMNTSTISVSIKAAQTDDSLKTAESVVTVTVEDVNDNNPEFDQSQYSVLFLENSPEGAVVFKATVTDLDQGGFVGTLRILPESAPFSISSDGTVRVKNPSALDRETTESFNFQIEATETNPPHSVVTVPVNVTLLDENDNSPKFTSNKYEGNVFANQTEGMLLVQVTAEDPDADVNGQIKYSIDFGNNDGYFTIDENNGEISLVKTIPLKENTILKFPLFITARDGGTISRSTMTQVDISAPGNSNPQFLQGKYHGTVEEEQEPGVVIVRATFLAIDGGVPVTLNVETESEKFSISPNGDVTTKVKLDHDESSHNYSVEISISDGKNTGKAIVEVQVTDINDNAPVFGSSSVTKSVPEDAEEGTNVTVVLATDKDSSFNKEIRYSLRGGEGKFSVDPVSGMVSLASVLDRETKAEYNMLVVAEDQGRPARSATATLVVQVTDINDNVPEFSKTEYQAEVLETMSVDETFLTLSAVDPDEGTNGQITYSILEQTPSSDPAVFALDSITGALRLVQTLDYSKVKAYSLMVQASDGGTPSLVGNSSVVVMVKDVNNNQPEFSKETYDVAIFENLASGASILTLEVTDKDEGGFSDGYFLYNNDTFSINKQGVVSLRKDVTLDRETKDSYILQVVAVDQVTDGLSATAQLNVTILDFNDNTPQFPEIPDPLWILEGGYSEKNPGEIFQIVPTDDDLSLNGEVVLSLASSHPLFKFRKDGMLLAVGPLDRESKESYELLVKASDKGNPQRVNITTIRVTVSDINDNRPEFSSDSYISSILLKDAEKGKLLLTLSATDKDNGNNSLITYSFIEGATPYLALNSETGEVTLTSNLTSVTEDTTLVLTAMAKDHGVPSLNSTVRVVVNLRVASLVENVAFLNSSYSFSLPENQPAGVTVGSVWASSGNNLYDVTYELKTHTDLFSVDASGAIVTNKQLDKEEQEWYFLEVEAVDTRVPPTSAHAMVRVQVEDVNEPPQFDQEVYQASIFSISPYKSPVINVKATDTDVGDEARLNYSMSDSSNFDMDPSSGLVFVVSAADIAGQLVKLEVKATDPQGLSATTKVEVEVKGSMSTGDVVTISLNQPVHVVDKKAPALEKSLGAALGWTVNILEVSSGGAESRALRSDVRTLVSFIALNGQDVVSSEEVKKKLQKESNAVTAELVRVFGEGTHFNVEGKPVDSASNSTVIIILGVLLAVSSVGLIICTAFLIWIKKNKKNQDDKESFDIGRTSEGYTNWTEKDTGSSATKQEDKLQDMDRKSAQWDIDMNDNKNSDASHMSSL